MPSDRTFVTELATGLGMLGEEDTETALARRPSSFRLTAEQWDRLGELAAGGRHDGEFAAGFANGRAFLAAPDALGGRRPRLVEWTGGRRPPGDEVVPSDLRIDHVYLVSCKYLSQILANPSPARLVEGLLSQAPVGDSRDWYQRVAAEEHQELYARCRAALGAGGLPPLVEQLGAGERRRLAAALRSGWPAGCADAYVALCGAVSRSTAERWRARLDLARAEAVLWRLLRIGSAPYFVLGTSPSGSMRLRIDTPWDWRQAYRLRRFSVTPQPGGQPRVGWSAAYELRRSKQLRLVEGHVEIRWSHGRFAQPPEAKVYLDTPHPEVPGYHRLEHGRAAPGARRLAQRPPRSLAEQPRLPLGP